MNSRTGAGMGDEARAVRPGTTRRRTTTKRLLGSLLGFVVAAAVTLGFTPTALAANPDPVQTYYVPFQEDQILAALVAIQPGGGGTPAPASPVTTYITITTVANNTVIYYDQWENGYDPDIANPINIYSGGNLGGTQIWGDNNAANGIPPGFSTDVINSGSVITLRNNVATGTRQSVIDFDGQDKFAATKTIAVTRTSWASGSSTLFAGCVEVFDTNNWGTDFRAPVGTDIPDGTDYQMFEYTSLSIMAGEEGATVSVDVNHDGTFEYLNQVLTQGQVLTVSGNDNSGAGLYVGAHVVSDKPVQVDILSGDIGSNYESRDSALLPTNLWASSYYTPVSTPTTAQGSNGVDTSVWLYNPDPNNSISVTYARREGATTPGTLTTSTITVPAGSYYKQVITQNTISTGAHFYTSGAAFYAYSITNSTETNNGNQAWDWSFTLIPQSSLTTQALVGLGIGRDPESTTNPTENGNPLWLTTVGNGETAQIVYIDYDADPSTGPLTDPNGNKYDTSVSLRELEPTKIYVPDTFTVDTTTSATTGNANNLSSLTWSHTTGTNQHRLMLVGVAIGQDATVQNVTSVTYGGQALTFVGRRLSDAGGTTRSQVEIWGLTNPPSGAANVVVTLAGNRPFAASATTFSGVNISGGLASALGTFTSAQGNTTTPTVNVTTSVRQAVYDVVCATRGGGAVDDLTAGVGQTALWQRAASFGGSPYMRGEGSWERATATSTTMSWTMANDRRWAIGAVPINTRDTLDQTGVLAYTLAANGTVKLAAAWGQDPLVASASAPGLDVGTSIPPMPEFSPGKSSTLTVDSGTDPDGYISPGDILTYTITAYNISRLPVPDVIIRDTIPSGCDYVPNSTYKGATLIPDNPTGGGATAFPLDNDGVYDGYNAGTIGLNGSVTVTFQAQIKTYEALVALGGLTSILNGGSGAALGIRLPVSDQAKLRGRLGDVIWNDVDQDGIQDPGEVGVAGVTVRLLTTSLTPVVDDNGVAITGVTDASGKYDFKGLYSGDYVVEFELPGAWNAQYTLTGQGSATEDSNAVVTGNPLVARTSTLTLGGGQDDRTWDGGIHPPYPTLAVVSHFGASMAKSGSVVVEWETSSEAGTAGYYVERLDSKTGAWVRVNPNIVAVLMESRTGGSYAVVDSAALPRKASTYRLVEMETAGGQVIHGPYTVTPRAALPSGEIALAVGRGERTVRSARDVVRGQPGALSRSQKASVTRSATANQLRIELVEAGLYRVDATDIATGLGVSAQRAKELIAQTGVKLTCQGKTVAYMKAADNSSLYFYGQTIDNVYTATNVYWLTVGSGTTMLVPPLPPVEPTTSSTSTTVTTVQAAEPTTTTSTSIGMGESTSTVTEAGTEAPTTTTSTSVATDESGTTVTEAGTEPPTMASTTTETTVEAPAPETTTTTEAPAGPVVNTSFTQVLHLEQDVTSATGLFHNPTDDFWFWTYMSAGDATIGQRTLPIEAPDVLNGVSLAVRLHGASSTGVGNEHHIQVWLNSTLLGETRWTGTAARQASFDIPGGLLLAGSNEVKFVALKDAGVTYSIVGVDSMDLIYERSARAVGGQLSLMASAAGPLMVSGLSAGNAWVLDLADPVLPKVVEATASTDSSGNLALTFDAIQGRNYLVVGAAAALRPRAIAGVTAPTLAINRPSLDYVVITSPSLADAAKRLAAYRGTQRLRTAVVTTTEIYDAFSYGLATPQAIKSFIAYTTTRWKVAPRYVVLAGEGSYDYKNLTGSGDSLVPTLLVDTEAGLVASDVLLADNRGNDGVPEVAIGRLPAANAAELDALTAKMKTYEANRSGTWRKNAVLAADDPDEGGDFTASSETIAGLLPSTMQVSKAYMETLGLTGARTALLDGFRNGALFINYVGHGGAGELAHEDLFTKADVAALPAAGSRLPVFAALTCVVGNYEIPGWDGLGEALLMRADAGAIAVWSNAGLAENDDSLVLGRSFIKGLFGTSQTVILGSALQAAARGGAAAHLPVSLLHTYNLLGDPALRVQK